MTELIAYPDTAGEHGKPALANDLYAAPAITLDDWFGWRGTNGAGSTAGRGDAQLAKEER